MLPAAFENPVLALQEDILAKGKTLSCWGGLTPTYVTTETKEWVMPGWAAGTPVCPVNPSHLEMPDGGWLVGHLVLALKI